VTWREWRVSEMAELINGYPFDSTIFSPTGDVPLVRIRDITAGEFETFLPKENVPASAVIRNDDVVIGMDGDFNVVRWERGPAALNQRVCLLRANDRADARYLAYSLPPHLRVINDLTYSTTVKHLSGSQVLHIKMEAPSLDEQHAIADYLDQETAQIDALVAKQEEFIGLLRERRSRAREALAERVARGQRLRWILSEVDRRAGARAVDLPLLSVSIDWGVRRREETTDKLSRAEDLSHYKVCLRGDIVVNRMRALQGALGVAPEDGVVSPDYAVLRADSEVDSDWLAELMRTKAFVGEIVLRLRGIGGTDSGNVRTPRINTADLVDIRADVPCADVQRAELTKLVTETSRIDSLIAKTEEHIALAKERRSALITAAVTGQIDVRTARKAS
jgi:type I restriction enzyme, S subunit